MTKPVAIIPDIHADRDRLAASLAVSGDARLAFLGDFIDAKDVSGADDAGVLETVRSLIDSGTAVAVMGNHELNSILFHTIGEDGAPLRTHEPKNVRQHASFIARFGIASGEAGHWCDWFLTLPLWHDLGGARLVHACWDAEAIVVIAARRPDGRLRREDLAEVAAKSTPFARAVEQLTSGPEVRLPEGWSFLDGQKNRRSHVRLAWWRAASGTWREAALSVPDPLQLPGTQIAGAEGVPVYTETEPPVFVGHYKMTGRPGIDAPNAVCLDYPETPCIYRWRGEDRLIAEHLVVVRVQGRDGQG